MAWVKNTEELGTDYYCTDEHGVCRLTVYKSCPDAVWLSSLVVDENHRRRHIGERILRYAEFLATEELRCSVLSLQVKSGSWMEQWYKRRGFIHVADGYMEDMVIMTKMLRV